MKIYVPSRGRAGFIGFKNTTASWLRGATWVVPPDEQARYARALANVDDAAIAVPCPEEGIAKVRLWIGQNARAFKQAKFLMADDDLNFSVRKGPESFHLRPADRGDIDEMLVWTSRALDVYAHVSVSPRQANNNMPSGDVHQLIKYNKRTLRYLAYRTADFLEMEHGRVPVMEDFDVNLQLLRSGRKNIVTYWWCQDQRETGTAGGCSSYRTLEAHNAAAVKLAELHAPFVKLRTKVNKSGLSGAAEKLRERTEVTIQWEQAYESSQEKVA